MSGRSPDEFVSLFPRGGTMAPGPSRIRRPPELFEDAVCHAREMVRTGYYFLVNLSHFQKVYFPYCLGKRDGKGRLELWSLRLAADLSDYRRVQEIWMSPPT